MAGRSGSSGSAQGATGRDNAMDEPARPFSATKADNSRRHWVVLDRDGTIIEERHYLSDPEQVALIPDAAQGLRQLQEMGFGLVVVTNQSGIGRGYFDNATLDLIHHRVAQLLESEGVHLDGFYHCPHLPEDDCQCRKPKTSLLKLAANEMKFNPQNCVVVGDKASDIEMGKRIGATTFLVLTGYGAEAAKNDICSPDHTVSGLAEAAQTIKSLIGAEEPQP